MGTEKPFPDGRAGRRQAAPTAYILLLLLMAGCSTAPANTSRLPTGDPVADLAFNLVGSPYRYGGTSPKRGFDCSGLVTYTHHKVGVTVPRTADAQYLNAEPVRRRDLRPGDLVFFAIPGRRDLHVGIYTGNGTFVHAPSSGKRVRSARMDDPYWSSHYLAGGRYR